MTSDHLPLSELSALLIEGGYRAEERDLEGIGRVVVAENPLALVMAIELPAVDSSSTLEDAQARLTALAAAHPSPRSWDLYLVVVENGDGDGSELRALYEPDTRYSRKLFVRPGTNDLKRELRGLLPLHDLPEVKISDSLHLVEGKLLDAGVDAALAAAAINSFSELGKVEIP
jgi:hypothetical protein